MTLRRGRPRRALQAATGLVLLWAGVSSCGRGADTTGRRPTAATPSFDAPPIPGPPAGARWRVVPGTIQWVADRPPEPAQAAAETIFAGGEFSVTVTSLGSPGCTRPAGAQVEYPGPALAVVTPLDSEIDLAGVRPRPGEPIFQCDLALTRLRRPVALRLGRPGPATIRVRGRSRIDSGIATRDTQVVVRTRRE